MDLVAIDDGVGRDMDGADARQRLHRLERRLDIEEPEAVDGFRLALQPLPVMNAPAQHLITAAQAEHPAAAPQMGPDVGIPTLLAQKAQIGNGRLGSGDDDEIGMGREAAPGWTIFDANRRFEASGDRDHRNWRCAPGAGRRS